MPYKKQDEPIHWKNKLEHLENVPGEPAFDKNAAWEKLQNRLQKKPGRKKVMWYWMAAACIVVAVITGIIISEKQQPATAKINHQKNNIILPEKNQTIKNEKTSEERAFAISQKTTKEIPSLNKKHFIDNAYTSAPDAIITIANNNKQKVALPEINIVTPLVPDTSSSIIAAIITPKKKLKVVHINELGNPPADEVIMARNRDLIFHQNILSKHTVAYAELFPREYPIKNILSIKLNPQK